MGFVLDSILTTAETGYVLNSIETSAIPTTTVTYKFDGGNCDPDLCILTDADTMNPKLFLDVRPESLSAGGWRFLQVLADNAEGKIISVTMNRETMWEASTGILSTWLPGTSQDRLNWDQVASRTLSGSAPNRRILFDTGVLPAGPVYISTHPMPGNSHAADFTNELLTTYGSVASPTDSAGVDGVFNVSPYEEDEDGLPVGENDMFSVKLAWGGSTTDGRPKGKGILQAGIHGAGEHFSWLAFEEGIRWLLTSSDDEAARIRANFDIYAYYNLNPNGIVSGHGRWSPEDTDDPNRAWYDGSRPEINEVKAAILADTGGSADFMFSFHTWGVRSELYVTVTDTSPAPSAATTFLIDAVETVQPDLHLITDDYTNTDFVWATNELGCVVALPIEMGMRAPTAVAGVKAIGPTWLKALAVTDEEGYFYEPPDGLVARSLESASEVSTPSLGQTHNLVAVSIESASEVSTPAVATPSPPAVLVMAVSSTGVLYANSFVEAASITKLSSTGTLTTTEFIEDGTTVRIGADAVYASEIVEGPL